MSEPAATPRTTLLTVSATRLVTSLGYYLSIPMLGLIALKSGGMTTAQVGVLIATHTLFRRALSVPVGIACDRWGARRLFLLGLFGETAAYLLLAGSSGFGCWLAALVIDGTAGSLYNSGARTLLARAADQGLASSFAGFYIATNLGALVGPLAAAGCAALGEARLPLTLSAATYAASALAGLWSTRRLPDTLDTTGRSFTRAALAPLRNRLFLAYCTATVPLWYGVSLLVSALPLEAELRHLGSFDVALVNSLNAGGVVVAAKLLGRRADRWDLAARLRALAAGSVVMAAGTACCLLPGRAGLYGGMALITLGELAIVTAADAVAVQLGPNEETGAYLGYLTSAWAAGGVLAGLLAGPLLDGSAPGHLGFWTAGTALELLGAIAMHRLVRRGAAHTRPAPVPEEQLVAR